MTQQDGTTTRVPGIKVPMGRHEIVYSRPGMDGYDLTCSCGWKHSGRYPASMFTHVAEADIADAHANHVRHMALVHDAQTHSDSNCGRSCIYPRNPDRVPDQQGTP